ncbi:MAG: AMP-binding protein [Clostridia bacterium]|nr:AMP-binding protein [Clostridia bacterium]
MGKKRKDVYYDVPQVKTIKELVMHGVGKGQDKPLCYYTRDEKLESKSYNDIWRDINAIGTYSFSLGIKKSNVAIIGENSYEWIASFFANLLGQNVSVPLDPKLPAEDLVVLLKDSGCKAIFYSKQYEKYIETFKAMGAPMEHYFCMADFPSYVEKGEKLIADGYTEYMDTEVVPEDLATIVYTSGTTGKSKGVMLSHGNLASQVVSACMCYSGRNTVGFLPLNHTYSWVATIFSGFIVITHGYICEDIKNLVHDFKTHKPQHFAGVPLVVETIYKRIWKTAKKTGREDVLKKGIKISNFLLKFGIDVRRKLFATVHEQLGGNLEFIVVGGAALDPQYEQGLSELGIQVLNGYGITECSPGVTTNTVHNYKSGSVGRPLPCNEIKINDPDEDGVGEIYVRGSNVMQGYYNDPVATAEAFDDGWFKTGDYGRIDEDGFLFFIGRKKNLIVTNNGKNVSPEELEDRLSQRCHAIAEILVYQDKNKIVAEIFPDFEEYKDDAVALIKEAVDKFNRDMPRWKNIDKTIFRDEEFPKTTTLKIRRNYGDAAPVK